MTHVPANLGYTFGFSNEHSRSDDLFVANEFILASTDIDLYAADHETLDNLGIALVVDSEGGPSGVDDRNGLDWMVMCTTIGTHGPEPIAIADIKLNLSLEQRQNLYATCVQNVLHYKRNLASKGE